MNRSSAAVSKCQLVSETFNKPVKHELSIILPGVTYCSVIPPVTGASAPHGTGTNTRQYNNTWSVLFLSLLVCFPSSTIRYLKF